MENSPNQYEYLMPNRLVWKWAKSYRIILVLKKYFWVYPKVHLLVNTNYWKTIFIIHLDSF